MPKEKTPPPKEYKLFGLTDQYYTVSNNTDIFLSGTVDLYITESLNLNQYCNITEISKLNLFSKKLEIRYNEKDNSTNDYQYNKKDNSIIVHHNFNR